jgi:hypothetical protein
MAIEDFYTDTVGVYTKTTTTDSEGYKVETLTLSSSLACSIREQALTVQDAQIWGLSGRLADALKVWSATSPGDNTVIRLASGAYYDVVGIKTVKDGTEVHHYETIVRPRG